MLILLLLQFFFGFTLTSHFLPEEINIYIVLSFSVSYGLSFSSIIFFAFSLFLGQSLFNLFVNILVMISTIFAFKLYITKRKKTDLINKFKRDSDKITCLSLIVYFYISVYLCKKTYFPKEMSLPTSMIYSFQEDLSIQNSLMYGINSGFTNIFMLKNPLAYKRYIFSRFLLPQHNVMLRLAGLDLPTSFRYVSTFEVFSFFVSSYLLGLEFGLNRFFAFIGPFISLYNGGFGFFRYLSSINRGNRNNDYFNDLSHSINIRHNPLLSLYLGTRSVVLSYSFIINTYYIVYGMTKKNIMPDKVSFKFFGFSTGLLFLAISDYLFVTFIIFIILYYNMSKFFLRRNFDIFHFVYPFILGCSFHISRVFHPQFVCRFLLIRSMWSFMYENGCIFPQVDYILYSFGIFPYIIYIGSFFLNSSDNAFIIPIILTSIISSYFGSSLFPENNIYNHFIIFNSISGILYLYISSNICYLIKDKAFKGIISSILTIIAVLSLLSTFLGSKKQWNTLKVIMSSTEEKISNWLMSNTDKKSIFYIDDMIFNSFLIVSGRQVFLSNEKILRLSDIYYSDLIKIKDDKEIYDIVDYFIIDTSINESRKIVRNLKKLVSFNDISIYQGAKTHN